MKWKTAKKAVMLLCVFTLVFSLSTAAFAEGPDTPDEPPDTPKIKRSSSRRTALSGSWS